MLANRKRWFRWGILVVALNSAFFWLVFINHVFALQLTSVTLEPPSGPPFPQNLGDAGDAPDSLLAYMTAYPGTLIKASFPTIYVPDIPSGPYHFNAGVGAYLGQAVSKEINADQLPDFDGPTNIITTTDTADRDNQDDGIGWIEGLELSCHRVTLEYTVTVELPNTPFFLNMWFDFDRDGSWGYEDDCGKEWAVQNHMINLGGNTGLITRTISFTTTDMTILQNFGNPIFDPLWLRVTLSEEPLPTTAFDGSGLPEGFLYGETEDYFLCRRAFPADICTSPLKDPLAGWRG